MSNTVKVLPDSTGMNGRLVNPYFQRHVRLAHAEFESTVKTYPFTKQVEPGVVVECEPKYEIRFRHRNNYGQYKQWHTISKEEFNKRQSTGVDYFQTRQTYSPIEQPKEEKKEVLELDINDFAISEQDLERAFCFGWLSNPDNPIMDNTEMMRRYELFKTQYLLPMLQRKHIID